MLTLTPQVVGMGYPSTMGAFHDYVIGDRTATPLEHHAQFSERIVQVRLCTLCAAD
jgi:predicted O-linked N-acetylglucosamine transferase (SPINDLY family)